MTTLLVIVWLVCGIFGALIFQAKNRTPWKGAVLGFLLGLIGVFIAALLSKQPSPRETF